MSEMSPLLRLVLAVMRVVVTIFAGLLVAIIGVFLWQHHGADGFDLRNGAGGFLTLLIALLAFCLYMIRSITSELKKPQADG
jgi:hypothetical protein